MEHREFKDLIYNEFSRISKALSSPKRFELVDLLTQGPKTVEKLAIETKMSVANTSKHLQALLEAKLVKFSKDKNFVYYSIYDQTVSEVLRTIINIAETRFSDLSKWKREYIERDHKIRTIPLEEMVDKLQEDEAILIDVRPHEEFENKHISGALSIPLQNLTEHIPSLPKDKKIIAYCRGPYCVYATEAVEILNFLGYEAYRIDEGVHEWKQSINIH